MPIAMLVYFVSYVVTQAIITSRATKRNNEHPMSGFEILTLHGYRANRHKLTEKERFWYWAIPIGSALVSLAAFA
ncbi:hypothetical protein [Roseovarius albus]|uniref:hypothetical protein n=1 Tax=Roseovarius albus TaxID=1247867 RepID=UPI000A26D811|nr:hypothetical protein [Roseovarius albus]